MASVRNRSPSLWRGTHFCLGDPIFIFGHGELDVCDGCHRLVVMKKIEGPSKRQRLF